MFGFDGKCTRVHHNIAIPAQNKVDLMSVQPASLVFLMRPYRNFSVNGVQSAIPGVRNGKAHVLSSTGLIIAPPVVNSLAARSISVAHPVANGHFTPEPQIHSISLFAADAYPVVATIPDSLGRKAAAVLVLAGVGDAEWCHVRSGLEVFAVVG